MVDELEVFENRVRERAFDLWREAGCPENSAEDFWHRARAIEMDQLDLTPQKLDQAKNAAAVSDAADFA